MKTRIFAAGLIVLFLCGAKPKEPHPLNLIIPNPNEATHTACFLDTPDETVLTKITSLELATRKAHPNAKPWSIYITPEAANIKIKGWKANLNSPYTPLNQASLGVCLNWICRRDSRLCFELIDDKVLISVKKKIELKMRAEGKNKVRKFPGRNGDLLSWEEARKMILSGNVKRISMTHMYGILLNTKDNKTYQTVDIGHIAVSEVVEDAKGKGILIECGKE